MAKINQINLKQLRTLRSINEAGNLTLAGERIGLTTPAVSVQIKAIEEIIGAQILIRGPDGKTEPTQVGIELLTLIKILDNQIEHSLKYIESLKSGKTGHVTIGVVSTAQYYAPWIIANARDSLPNIEIDLIVGNRNEIISALDNRMIDMAIMGRPPRVPPVQATALGDHPHIMIAATESQIYKKINNKRKISSIELKNALLDEVFLVREPGSGTRILLDRFLDEVGAGTVFSRKEMSSTETIKQAVMADLGIALISKVAIEKELKEGSLIELKISSLPIVRQWYLVHPIKVKLSPTAEVIKQFMVINKKELLKTGKVNKKLVNPI